MSTVEQEALSPAHRLSFSSPIKVGDIELRNRNVMSSMMTRNRSGPGTVPNDAYVEYYAQRAERSDWFDITEGILTGPQGWVLPRPHRLGYLV